MQELSSIIYREKGKERKEQNNKMQSKKKEEYQIRNNEQKESKSEYPALVA